MKKQLTSALALLMIVVFAALVISCLLFENSEIAAFLGR